LARADVAIVCDMYTPIDTPPPQARYRREIEWLQRMHARGALIASVCSGSLILAEAGLLDGRQCAAHWAYRELFRARYPLVNLCIESILSLESEPEMIITAAAVTAWQDLALHIIKRFCGSEHALRTAKVYLLGSHTEGQLPFAAMVRQIQKNDAVISKCQEWIALNYASADPVAAMSNHSGLHPRTFSRRFRGATGHLPIDYVHALRIEEAKRLIEERSIGLDDVGYQVGYEDPTFFRGFSNEKSA